MTDRTEARSPDRKPGQGFVPDGRRTIMLLDVDVAVNAGVESPWPDATTGWPRVRTEWGQSMCKVTTSKHLGAALLALDAEIRWLTTWGSDANRKISRRAGLPGRLPIAGFQPDDQRGSMGWKVEIVVDTLTSGRKVIWVDDEADPTLEAEIRARVPDGDLLVVWTNPDSGITPADIELMRAHLAADSC